MMRYDFSIWWTSQFSSEFFSSSSSFVLADGFRGLASSVISKFRSNGIDVLRLLQQQQETHFSISAVSSRCRKKKSEPKKLQIFKENKKKLITCQQQFFCLVLVPKPTWIGWECMCNAPIWNNVSAFIGTSNAAIASRRGWLTFLCVVWFFSLLTGCFHHIQWDRCLVHRIHNVDNSLDISNDDHRQFDGNCGRWLLLVRIYKNNDNEKKNEIKLN